MPLTAGLDAVEFSRRLVWSLSRVSDYDGANNHMGSRFTASREALLPVMRELSARKLFFLDSAPPRTPRPRNSRAKQEC